MKIQMTPTLYLTQNDRETLQRARSLLIDILNDSDCDSIENALFGEPILEDMIDNLDIIILNSEYE